nr:thermonuclease family protein [Qipengyuania aerophila]
MRSLPILLLVALAVPANAEVVSGTAQAFDGDTLVLNDRQVRLAGIDAPELDQHCQRDGQAWECGEEAKRQLNSMIAGQTVYCQGEGVDQYGRLLGTCSANRMNLNASMVEYGWATAYRAYSDDYLAQEHRARSAKAGIWKSEFALPEQHRIAAREASRPAATVAPARSTMRRSNSACDIKGNRSRRGDWIYHLPGMQYYEQTRPEEIFCSESEAIAAGYRRSTV